MSGPVYNVLKDFVYDTFRSDLRGRRHPHLHTLVAGENTLERTQQSMAMANAAVAAASSFTNTARRPKAVGGVVPDPESANDKQPPVATNSADGQSDSVKSHIRDMFEYMRQNGHTVFAAFFSAIWFALFPLGPTAHAVKNTSFHYANFVSTLMYVLLFATAGFVTYMALNIGTYGSLYTVIPFALYCGLTCTAYAYVMRMSYIILPDKPVCDVVVQAPSDRDDGSRNSKINTAEQNKPGHQSVGQSIAWMFFASMFIAFVPIVLLIWGQRYNKGCMKDRWLARAGWVMILCTVITFVLNVVLTLTSAAYTTQAGATFWLIVKDVLVMLALMAWISSDTAIDGVAMIHNGDEKDTIFFRFAELCAKVIATYFPVGMGPAFINELQSCLDDSEKADATRSPSSSGDELPSQWFNHITSNAKQVFERINTHFSNGDNNGIQNKIDNSVFGDSLKTMFNTKDDTQRTDLDNTKNLHNLIGNIIQSCKDVGSKVNALELLQSKIKAYKLRNINIIGLLIKKKMLKIIKEKLRALKKEVANKTAAEADAAEPDAAAKAEAEAKAKAEADAAAKAEPDAAAKAEADAAAKADAEADADANTLITNPVPQEGSA